MIKKFTVFNDLHIGAPYQLYDFSVNLTEMVEENSIGISIGDNYDRKNAKKSSLLMLEDRLARHRSDFEGRFLTGNHEIEPIEIVPYLVVNDICFMHGDILFWGYAKSAHRRGAYSPGASAFKRMFVKFSDELRMVAPKHIKQSFFDQCEKYLKMSDCKTIVCGHFHPEKVEIIERSFGKIVILPRGRNVIEI